VKDQSLDITGFLSLVLESLKAAGVEYLIGGAIAEWAWGEPRATQDLNIVIKLPGFPFMPPLNHASLKKSIKGLSITFWAAPFFLSHLIP
jgi:hypothetical protein